MINPVDDKNFEDNNYDKPWIVFDIDGTLSLTVDIEDYETLDPVLQQQFVH